MINLVLIVRLEIMNVVRVLNHLYYTVMLIYISEITDHDKYFIFTSKHTNIYYQIILKLLSHALRFIFVSMSVGWSVVGLKQDVKGMTHSRSHTLDFCLLIQKC